MTVRKEKPRVFIDMDGVIVDFAAHMNALGITGEECKKMPGAYAAMPAMPGAIEAVRSIIGAGYEVWIATKPPTGVPCAYGDKAAWILEHLPELKRNIIVTHHKGMLGRPGDFIIDDRPHKAHIDEFPGTVIVFGGEFTDETGSLATRGWPEVLAELGIGVPRKLKLPGAMLMAFDDLSETAVWGYDAAAMTEFGNQQFNAGREFEAARQAAIRKDDKKYAVFMWADQDDELYYTPESAALARSRGMRVRELYTLVNGEPR